MNTNSVFCAKICRLTGIIEDANWYFPVAFNVSFSRETLVYQKSDEIFYDLLTERDLKCDFGDFSKIGTEFVVAKTLIPFNVVVNQNKENLSKRKIKKLYREHKNNI